MAEGPIDHTFLMNSTIAMLQNSSDWPTPLYDMGYRIDYVEQTILVGELGKLTPDIISKIFERNNILLLECKGGKAIRRKQLEKLLNVEGEHLKLFVSVRNRDQIVTLFSYVVKSYSEFIDELDSIFPEIDEQVRNSKNKDDIDVIVIKPDLVQVHTKDDSNWTPELINGIQITEGDFPQYFIPFSLNDKGEWILRLIARELVSLLIEKGKDDENPSVTASEIVESMFKIYNKFPRSEFNKLQDKVKDYFEKLSKKRGFHKKLESIGRGAKISVKSLKDAIEELDNYGNEIYEDEIKNQKLDEFA